MVASLLALLTATCPVSLPNRHGEFNYGTRQLRTAIYWPRGVLEAGIRPDGGAMAIVNRDGSISVKVGWWRGVPGTLRVQGRRLDGLAGPIGVHVPSGYGNRGFQPSGVTFPTTGCWRVVGTVATARLSLVIKVVKLRR